MNNFIKKNMDWFIAGLSAVFAYVTIISNETSTQIIYAMGTLTLMMYLCTNEIIKEINEQKK